MPTTAEFPTHTFHLIYIVLLTGGKDKLTMKTERNVEILIDKIG